ncbi:MAG TPA: biotin/lipoyl-binding protein [Bryobacteraceae bacterium]|nr:biotin/lipoyl-binding protein [Bryobacteraceae bacterium]
MTALKVQEPEAITIAEATTPRHARSSTRWLAAGFVLALLAGAGAYIRLRGSGKPSYTTARVDRGNIESTVTTTGNLNAVITVQVGSQVSGNIIALYADFNTKVRKGQLVAEINPAPFKAAVDQASATLNAAKAGVVTSQAAVAKSKADFRHSRGQCREPESKRG